MLTPMPMQHIDERKEDNTPSMCLAMVAVASMLEVWVGEHDSKGRRGGNGGSRRSVCWAAAAVHCIGSGGGVAIAVALVRAMARAVLMAVVLVCGGGGNSHNDSDGNNGDSNGGCGVDGKSDAFFHHG
jgi:hypothetical protein